jgi:hypothetical protein
MAIRQCYLSNEKYVEIFDIDFNMSNGFAKSQKQKSILSLHEVIINELKVNKNQLLEVSSKSFNEIGIALSAFNLSAKTKKHEVTYTVESAFQSSKVFEGNIQYKDIMQLDSKSAKTDRRLKESGKLSYFQFYNHRFELNTGTSFYDWLYINVLLQNPKLCDDVMQYRAFTDIEFNSKKSMNTQAFAIALFVTLKLAQVDMSDFSEPEVFLNVTLPFYNKLF